MRFPPHRQRLEKFVSVYTDCLNKRFKTSFAINVFFSALYIRYIPLIIVSVASIRAKHNLVWTRASIKRFHLKTYKLGFVKGSSFIFVKLINANEKHIYICLQLPKYFIFYICRRFKFVRRNRRFVKKYTCYLTLALFLSKPKHIQRKDTYTCKRK